MGHSPLRPTQYPDLVALVGKFEVDEAAPTLKGLDAHSLSIEPDRLFYLLPRSVVREHSKLDGRSQARALIAAETIRSFAIDLEQGTTNEHVLSLLATRDGGGLSTAVT